MNPGKKGKVGHVIVQDPAGPCAWDLQVPGAYLMHDAVRSGTGEVLRVFWRVDADTVELTVGHGEDPHWSGLSLPGGALDDLVAMLDQLREERDRRLEDAALARGRPSGGPI